MERDFDKEFKVRTNKLPGVVNGHTLKGNNFMYVYIAKTL